MKRLVHYKSLMVDEPAESMKQKAGRYKVVPLPLIQADFESRR